MSKPTKASGRSPRPPNRPASKVEPPPRQTTEEDAFVRSLIAHGQAAKRGPDGSLPPGATHELIEDEHGRLRAVRRKFSAL